MRRATCSTTWKSGAALEAGGVRVIGHRFSKDSHDLRDFLARNRVPARWLDVERDGEARELLRVAGVAPDRLPVALLEDGARARAPDRAGARRAPRRCAPRPPQDHYDLVIVGGGPAGLAAAVYGASEGLRTVLVEREAPGGQAGQSSRIENYLGFPSGLSGSDLARPRDDAGAPPGRRAAHRPGRRGADASRAQAGIVELTGGTELSATACSSPPASPTASSTRPASASYTGAGIYYGAALTEARSCADQHVVIIGGANSAGQAAVYFAAFAARVTMLVRVAARRRA